MSEMTPAVGEDKQQETEFLISLLHETQQRLQELGGSELDAVLHPGGRRRG